MGGDLDGTFVRSWCGTGDPYKEADALQRRFSVTVLPNHRDSNTWAIDTRGEYVLVETVYTKKTKDHAAGERKYATADKKPVPMSHYEWSEV